MHTNKLFFLLIYFFHTGLIAQNRPPLVFEKKITIENLKGPVTAMDIDLKGQRLFLISGLLNSLTVTDLSRGKILYSTDQLKNPTSIAYISYSDQLFIADGDGLCRILNAKDFSIVNSFILGSDVDNVHYDNVSKKLFVAYGKAISVIEPSTGKITRNLKLAGHPAGFDFDFKRNLMYVSIPSRNQIEVVNLLTLKSVKNWKIKENECNNMMFDRISNHLFITSQNPAHLLVFDAATGKQAGSYECPKNPGNLEYDNYLKRIFIACGEGMLEVFQKNPKNDFVPYFRLPTANEVKTLLMVPLLNRIYVAFPGIENQQAEVSIYKLQN